MPYATSSGCRIHWSSRGDGTPLLLLAGLGAGPESWGTLLPHLAGGHRCLVVDNRGTGASTAAARGFGIADMADDAAAVLDQAGLDSAHVLGNSLGGMIAQAMALRHPGRVRSLVLAATSPGVPSIPSHPGVLYRLIRSTRGAAGSRRAELAAAFHGPATLVDHPERLDGDGDLLPPPSPGMRRQLSAAMRWSALPWLRRIGAPTLVVHGTHDRLVPAVNARILAALIPDARLHLLPRAGHFFITDAGLAAGQAIRSFLASIDLPPAAPTTELRGLAVMPGVAPA